MDVMNPVKLNLDSKKILEFYLKYSPEPKDDYSKY